MLDIGRALDLLAVAVAEREANFVNGTGPTHTPRFSVDDGPQGLVARALLLAGVTGDVSALIQRGVLELYRDDRLPVPMTLGAALVLDAAQRCQDRTAASGDALEHAIHAAERFLDLVPESLWDRCH